MVSACGLHISAGSPIPGCYGLGTLRFITVKHLVLRCMYAEIYEKIFLSDFLVDKFMEFYATMPSLRGSGFKDRNVGGFFPSEKVPKNILGLRWPSLPHNLG